MYLMSNKQEKMMHMEVKTILETVPEHNTTFAAAVEDFSKKIT